MFNSLLPSLLLLVLVEKRHNVWVDPHVLLCYRMLEVRLLSLFDKPICVLLLQMINPCPGLFELLLSLAYLLLSNLP